MSERTHAPRSGGRVKDQRGTVPARDAQTQQGAGQHSGRGGSDARGARHFSAEVTPRAVARS